MKKWKWKKILFWLVVYGSILHVLDYSGVINLRNRPTEAQEVARAKFKIDYNALVGKPASLMPDTIVVYVSNEKNPFLSNPDEYAGSFHPRLINGQTCAELNISFIQVRNINTDKMLSGIQCVDQ